MNDDSIATLQPEPQSQAVAIEPQAEAVEPQAEAEEPQEVATEPQTVAEKPQPRHSMARQADTEVPADTAFEPADTVACTVAEADGGISCLQFGLYGDSTGIDSARAITLQGEGGDPMAYTPSQNATVGTVLIVCFLLIVYAISKSRGLISKIARNVLDNRRSRSMAVASLPELRYLLLLIACMAAECGLLYFNDSTSEPGYAELTGPSIVVAYMAIALAYIVGKGVLFAVVNWVFFTRSQRAAWTDVYVFLTAALGVALFPIAVAQTYLNPGHTAVTVAVALAVGAQKLVSARKAYDIFFSHGGGAFHVVPYFLTLDVLPIGILLTACELCRDSLMAGM